MHLWRSRVTELDNQKLALALSFTLLAFMIALRSVCDAENRGSSLTKSVHMRIDMAIPSTSFDFADQGGETNSNRSDRSD